MWRAATILDALRQRQPEMLAHLETIVAAWDTKDRDAVFEREFAAIKPISIDYAVMEHATDVAVIEAPFEWDDLGGWQSLARLAGSDENGNTIVGKHLGLDTQRHDRPHRRRAPGRHARAEGLHRRPHAECHAGGQQARRRTDPPGGEATRRTGLDGIPVSCSRDSSRLEPHDACRSRQAEFSYNHEPTPILCRACARPPFGATRLRAEPAAEAAGRHNADRFDVMNLLSKTAGGKQFWADVWFFHDWRIQRHALTGPLPAARWQRIIGIASGTFEACRERARRDSPARQAAPMEGKAVIVLHGLFRTRSRWTRSAQRIADGRRLHRVLHGLSRRRAAA